jgi:predicted phage terminase large subunit-like protein
VRPTKTSIEQEWQRRSLERFVEAAWPLVVPAPFVPGIHVTLICRALEQLAAGKITRLLITIPPRHGKTTLGSVLFPAWLWLQQPQTRFLTASYALDLATRDSLAMRRLVESPWYQRLAQGRVRLTDDQAAKTRYETTCGGARLAVSVGGSVTGEGGDVITLDDPMRIDQVTSQQTRESVIDWFSSSLSTRVNDPATARFLVIAHRLHERDLPGYLLSLGDWPHVCLPAEYDPHHPHLYPDDPRRTPGEPLWPAQWPSERLAQEKARLGTARTASMLQQLPAPTTGAIFTRANWRYYPPDAPPNEFDVVVQSWDLTFTDAATSDYVVGQVWGSRGADRYLLYQVRDRVSATATMDAIRATAAWVAHRYPRHATHRIFIEQAANGAAIIDMLRREIPGIQAIHPHGDKVNRASSAVVALDSGNVYLPGAANHNATSYDAARTPGWIQDLVEEATRFPYATHDDQVDAMTQALINMPTYRDQLHVSGPASLGSADRLRYGVAGMARRRSGVTPASGQTQTFADRLIAAGYQPRRSYPSLEQPVDADRS